MRGLIKSDWNTGLFYTSILVVITGVSLMTLALVHKIFEEGVVMHAIVGLAGYIGAVYIMAIVARYRRLK